MRVLFAATAIGLTSMAGSGAKAQVAPRDDTALEAISVWGKREVGIGVSLSASEGVVTVQAFQDRPLLRPGELAEVVPGLAATQHSGSGKANQYFLRGFNIDHGTDFSVSLDGAPLNLRSHAHGQGYLDLNGVVAELVETIRYHKGPYFADQGDFSTAGGTQFETFGVLPESYVEGTAGGNNYRRLLAAASFGDRGWLAGDLTGSDGPWDNPERLRKISLLGKAHLGRWSFTGLGYKARWNATDQIPERAVESGRIGRFGAIDTTDGGRTSRLLLAAQYVGDDGWTAALSAQRYTLSLWSNFTYFLDDPIRGDQFKQQDDRRVYAGSLQRAWPTMVGGWSLRTGLDGRLDDIGKVGLYKTQARRVLATVREDDVLEYSGALWTDAQRSFGPLRANLGVRLDAIGARVRADDRRNSGHADDVIASPKVSLAWRVSPAVEFYANAGRGFHSNDARGATVAFDPATGDPADPVDLFAQATGGEVGGRWARNGLSLTGSLWALDLDSELVYVGDGGSTESADPTRRAGAELLADWTPTDRLNLNLSFAATHARYRGSPVEGDRIPNAVEYVATAGFAARITDRASVTLTVRRLGPSPLIEDNSARSRPSNLLNGLVAYDFGPARVKVEVLNVLDSRDDDIRYFYTSRLPGEPSEGVEGYTSHPVEPRTVRVSIKAPIG